MAPVLITISTALFLAMLFNLAAKPKATRWLTGFGTIAAAVGGLFFYGVGFSSVLNDPILIVIRTVFAVCRMYAGVNDFSSISSAPIFTHSWTITVFWVFHMLAFYATASATISALGATALKKVKYWLQRYGSSVIIYGISDDTLDLGRSLIASGVKNIVYVGSKPDAGLEAAINTAGALVRSDASALHPDRKFLKSLGSQKGAPTLTLYALDDVDQSQVYAEELLSALEESNVDTANVRLILKGTDDSVTCSLSAAPGRYGYSDVRLFTEESLSGRMLMQNLPPCSKMKFNPDGTAAGDFDAVIIGFGKTGRSVLRNLVRSAQFEGSHFRAAIFSPMQESESGYFRTSYPDLMEQYDITLFSQDARSLTFYEYIRDHAATLRYVAICAGGADRRQEICTEVSAFLEKLHSDAAVCRCCAKQIIWSETPNAPVHMASVYSADVLGSDAVDHLAALLNYSYVNDPSVTAEDAWKDCDYFSRESSRAAADFIRAYLTITGKNADDVAANGWGDLSDEMKENLGRTEHLRWCAFHYSMGFSCMTEETIRARGRQYLSELQANGTSSIRITKDLTGRKHACLCSWDSLDHLAEVEAEYTGKQKDYKDMDIRNVLALPDVLRAAKEGKK